ncbi:hypothetical protein D3C72_2589900 [compost metagenome]
MTKLAGTHKRVQLFRRLGKVLHCLPVLDDIGALLHQMVRHLLRLPWVVTDLKHFES